jgi:redox-sensing transcriptional repressor
MVSEKTISRLTNYQTLLRLQQAQGRTHLFSHQLADLARVTPAQVRRDLMVIGYTGNPRTGYHVGDLQDSLMQFFAFSTGIPTALVGVGSLGRALLSYFMTGRSNIRILAAFDNDPTKAGRILSGCRIHPMTRLRDTLSEVTVSCALVTVPGAEAQKVTDALVGAGVHGIVNFAPVRLKVPPTVFVENLDVTSSIEKAAFFARNYSLKTQEETNHE